MSVTFNSSDHHKIWSRDIWKNCVWWWTKTFVFNHHVTTKVLALIVVLYDYRPKSKN